MLNKLYRSLVIMGILSIGYNHAQTPLASHTLEITFNKTSSVIFPAVIKSVDKGSRDVLAQKARGLENVLQLKAARENFPETNLTVITSDGTIHEFIIQYARQPDQQVLILEAPTSATKKDAIREALIFQAEMTESEMERYAKAITQTRKPLLPLRDKDHKITLTLNSIHIRDNVIFYHIRMKNQSNINYDVDFLRFFIRDQVKVKRTASQEVSVTPLHVFGDDKQIKGNSSQDVVYALGKFTIPEAKRLVIEMFESNGGRNLRLSIKNKAIVNAKLAE